MNGTTVPLMNPVLRIEAKVAGQRRSLVSDWHIPISPASQTDSWRMTLRDLITIVVEAEAEAFRVRAEQKRLTHILSSEQISEGVLRGKIDLGGKSEDEIAADIDPEQAVAAALQAFIDDLYFVFIDGVKQTSLEQTVFVKEETKVLFVRLVALVGG